MTFFLPSRGVVLLTLAAVQVPGAFGQAAAPAAPAAHRRPRAAAQPAFNPNIIVLDPAHGGDDSGARLGADSFEKDVTVGFANTLRDDLTARGFTVILTRADPGEIVTPDQRAEIANRAHADACLSLHATGAGRGLHLFTSALTPIGSSAGNSAGNSSSSFDDQPRAPAAPIIPWDTAQTGSLAQSLALRDDLAAELHGMHIPVLLSSVSVRPIDAMICPAVALEIGPERPGDPVTGDLYQQRIADLLTLALSSWREHEGARMAALEAAQAEAEAAARPPGFNPPATARPRTRQTPGAVPASPQPAVSKPVATRPVAQKPATLQPGSQPKTAPVIRRPPPAEVPQ